MTRRLLSLVLVAALMVPTSMPVASAGMSCVPFIFNPWCPGYTVLELVRLLGRVAQDVLDLAQETACPTLPDCRA